MAAQTRRRRLPVSALIAACRVTPKVLPALPEAAKRLMSGGRAVVIDGNTLDPTLQAFIASLHLAGVDGLVFDDDVALSRRMFNSLVPLSGPPVPADLSELSIPGPAGQIRVRHYRAADDGAPALVYFHGGGWVLGGLDSYDPVARILGRRTGVHVFSVDYRLAPEHPAPAALDDCLAAYRWVVAHAGELGVRRDRVAVGGDSAGGNLAAAVAQLTREDDVVPALQLLIYPVTDVRAPTRSRTLFANGFALTAHDIAWFGDRYLEGSQLDAADPRVSPARAADLTGLPPALVVTAGFDPLRDEGNAYAAALGAAGVSVDLREMTSMTHGFINFDGLGGGASACLAELASALRAHLRRA
ncbi:MAG TPA: alpha/beta hydrolase [Mycobacterium sp.]|nr:alpha/beta hydrolase [Mycobacterium sp.]